MRRRSLIAGLGLASASLSAGRAFAAAPSSHFAAEHFLLFMDQATFLQRTGNDTAAASAYLGKALDAVDAVFNAVPAQRGTKGVFVVMAKPGGKAKTWFAYPPATIPDDLVARATAAADKVPALKVQGGPVLFGMSFALWGGGPNPPGYPYMLPREIKQHIPQGYQASDEAMLKVWPN